MQIVGFPMTSIFRRTSIVLAMCVCTTYFGLVAAQGQAPREQEKGGTPQGSLGPCIEFEQIPLTEKQILGLLASADEIDEIRENSADGFYQTGPETTAKLDVVAKKNGLASYEEYKTARANVLQVFSGYDWTKGHYVGREQLIRIRVARAKADRSLSAAEKQEKIASLNAQRQCTLPEVKFKGNVELVRKYYARLEASKFQK
jgi:hypothetical protein